MKETIVQGMAETWKAMLRTNKLGKRTRDNKDHKIVENRKTTNNSRSIKTVGADRIKIMVIWDNER